MYSILIIEDEPALCCNIELILRMEGFDTRTAADGLSGLARISEKRPDLILCDILMPGMDGHTLLSQLKSEAELADIPFIFVTALGERSDVRRGMSSGADDYLTKPFTAEELVAAITGRLHRLETIRLFSTRATFREEHAILRQRISARELEILLLVGNGATSREIADRLGISLRTVEVHRSNLMDKLGAANAAILARWAVIAEQM
ncbi:MAG: response regulator transcription factor [Geobacteraceae bacterium]|nr:response regulator transcription factor [Geobacteraceae bacterium]